MSRLAGLEAKKLMRELAYLKSDLEYKNEIVSDADGKFISSVNNFLDVHPELKTLFDAKINERFERIISSSVDSSCDSRENAEEKEFNNRIEAGAKVKRLYREIAKLTHPDKVSDQRMNEMYLDAKRFYKEDDLIGMYGVCERLGIDYEVDEEELQSLKDQIEGTKERIAMLESTTTWVWNSSEDESFRNDIILRYVGSQIR